MHSDAAFLAVHAHRPKYVDTRGTKAGTGDTTALDRSHMTSYSRSIVTVVFSHFEWGHFPKFRSKALGLMVLNGTVTISLLLFVPRPSCLHFTMPLFQLNVIWRLHRLLVICEGRTSSHHFRYQGLRTVHNPYIIRVHMYVYYVCISIPINYYSNGDRQRLWLLHGCS